jgi:hypothetical protein
MTSYVTINNSEIDPDSPITADLMTKLRDNPIAVFTDDASVPADLKLGLKLLGTLTTTSGSSQTLSGLTLTPYKFILVRTYAVSLTSATSITIQGGTGSQVICSEDLANTGSGLYGDINIELATSLAILVSTQASAAPNFAVTTTRTTLTSVTSAVTSITFRPSAGTFDAGTIRVYGVK